MYTTMSKITDPFANPKTFSPSNSTSVVKQSPSRSGRDRKKKGRLIINEFVLSWAQVAGQPCMGLSGEGGRGRKEKEEDFDFLF